MITTVGELAAFLVKAASNAPIGRDAKDLIRAIRDRAREEITPFLFADCSLNSAISLSVRDDNILVLIDSDMSSLNKWIEFGEITYEKGPNAEKKIRTKNVKINLFTHTMDTNCVNGISIKRPVDENERLEDVLIEAYTNYYNKYANIAADLCCINQTASLLTPTYVGRGLGFNSEWQTKEDGTKVYCAWLDLPEFERTAAAMLMTPEELKEITFFQGTNYTFINNEIGRIRDMVEYGGDNEAKVRSLKFSRGRAQRTLINGIVI